MGHSRTRWGRMAAGGLLAVAVAIALTACGGSSSSGGTSSSSGPIKFGFLDALSGAYAVAGAPELDGAKLGVQDVNSAGGVCGRKLQLAGTADDQGQANLSIDGLRKLVSQDGLKFVIGPGITPPALAAAPVAESLKAWFMVQTAQRQPWAGRTYVFSDVTPQDVEGNVVFNYVKKKLGPGHHRVAIVYAAVPYAQVGYQQLKQLSTAAGWSVVAAPSYDPTALTFTSQATQVAQAKPDAVMVWGAAAPGDAKVIKQIRASGYTGPIVGDVSLSLPFIPADAGSAANGLISFSQLNTISPTPAIKKFLNAYQTAYKQGATYLPGAAYDAVHILAAAIKRSGCKTDATSVSKAMIGLAYQGVNGTYHYSTGYKGGPPLASSFRPVTFQNGKEVFAK